MRKRLIAAMFALAAVLGAVPVAPAVAAQTTAGCISAPTSSDTDVPWAQQQLAPQRVWPLTTGKGVIVGVVDTGVGAGTPQLAGRVLPGIDLVNPGGGPANTDCFGHGTFVAGIIGAAPATGTGFAGVAPGVTILPVRVANNDSDVTAGTIAAGIRAAVDAGASVINVSASTTVQTPALGQAVDYAVAHNVVLVASAANSAQSGDPVTYPASYPGVIAVGAIDSTGQRADFSQTGPYLDLVAPGVNVVSVGPGGPGQWEGSGTSYAAPFVAGTAALVRAYHPNLTAAQVRQRLEQTADHPATALPDPQLGWGTVNPMAAVEAVLPSETGNGAAAIDTPPPAHPTAAPGRGELDPAIAGIGIFVAVALVFAIFLARRAGRTGRRRGNRAIRVRDGQEQPRPGGTSAG